MGKIKRLIKSFLSLFYRLCIYKLLISFGYINSHKEKIQKIVIGCDETAGVLAAFKKMYGDACIAYTRSENQFYKNSEYDYKLKENFFTLYFITPYIFGKLLRQAKCFIYIGGGAFTKYIINELELIKIKKIKIAMIFLGSEIRSPVLFMEQAKNAGNNCYYEYLSYDWRNLENIAKQNAFIADKYADKIFSHKRDQISYITNPQYFFPPIIENSKICNSIQKFDNLEKIKILHAPSNPNVKGTPVVRSVIARLKKEGYDFEYIELKGVDNSVVIKELQTSHIVLNQFYLLLPGIFGLEAMANCTAVLMSAESSEFPYVFNDAWIETKDYQLYENLKMLLDNPKRIKYYAQNGYNYMRENFSYEKIKSYLDIELKDFIV